MEFSVLDVHSIHRSSNLLLYFCLTEQGNFNSNNNNNTTQTDTFKAKLKVKEGKIINQNNFLTFLL